MSSGPSSFRVADLSKFTLTRPPRPMLAREADSVYWMSRYVERAEHVARLLRVKLSLLTDAGDLDDALVDRLWRCLPMIFRCPDEALGDGSLPTLAGRVAACSTFSEANPNSILAVVTRARENARGVRETISAEMWETLNSLYWAMHADDARQRFEESPDAFLTNILSASMLFQGLADQTLRHDQRWHFIQLGKYIERIDYTCRVAASHWSILTAVEETLELPLRNIHWMGLLRSCCSIEAYRKAHLGEIDGLRVISFITLEDAFPRSIRYAIAEAYQAITAVADESDARKADTPQRLLGRLSAQLEYAELSEIVNEGVPAYLNKVESAIAEVALSLQRGYFLH